MILISRTRGVFGFAYQLSFVSIAAFAVATVCGVVSAEEGAEDERPLLVAVLAEGEYGTTKTVPKFAEEFLDNDFRVKYVFWKGKGTNRLPGIEALDEADVALLSARRITPTKEQLDSVRRYVAKGKPLVAIRTSSHAFCLRNKKPEKGNDEWPTFDREVLGCHYTGHAPTRGKNASRTTTVVTSKENVKHPILAGVDPGPRVSPSWLYYSRPLGKRTTPLLLEQAKGDQPAEPVAWTNVTKSGGKVFYTSLGSEAEFADPNFQKMLENAVRWAVASPSEH